MHFLGHANDLIFSFRISSNELDPEVKLNQYRRDQNIHNSSRRNAFVAVWINVPWTAFSRRLRIPVLGLFMKPEYPNPHSYLKIKWFIRQNYKQTKYSNWFDPFRILLISIACSFARIKLNWINISLIDHAWRTFQRMISLRLVAIGWSETDIIIAIESKSIKNKIHI